MSFSVSLAIAFEDKTASQNNRRTQGLVFTLFAALSISPIVVAHR
jgi:hypothetical protein